MSDLTKIYAEYRNEMLKHTHKHEENSWASKIENSDSEEKNTFIASTSSPIRSKATAENNTLLVRRNSLLS